MKKIVSILLIVIMCCGLLVGCSNKPETNVEKTDAQAERKEENEEKEVQTVPEIKLGEAFRVETEKGNYNLIIQDIRVERELQFEDFPEDKMLVVLVYEAENIDFGKEDEQIDGLLLEYNAFRVSDDNKYICDNYPLVPPDIQHPEIIPVGYKQKAGISYLINREATSVEVVLTRETGDVAKITVPIE